MKIAIGVQHDYSPEAALLTARLREMSYGPASIICVERPLLRRLREFLKREGLVATVRKILSRFHATEPAGIDSLYYLSRAGWAREQSKEIPPMSVLCRNEGIDFLRVDDVNSAETIEYVASKQIDVLIQMVGSIYRKPLIEAVKIGILNCHMGYLPAYRGMNVLEWSLFHGDRIGVTLHFIEPGIDTGRILRFKEIPIESGDTLESLRAKSILINFELLAECIPLLAAGQLPGTAQRPEDGKQYFVMHPRLKEAVQRKVSLLSKTETAVVNNFNT